jgi:hypothetical protein
MIDRRTRLFFSFAFFAAIGWVPYVAAASETNVVWRIDNIERIAGAKVTAVGNPTKTAGPAAASAVRGGTDRDIGAASDADPHSHEQGYRKAAGAEALRFDGFDDGCVVAANPLQGFAQFTIEILFLPERGGLEEQRFFHAQDKEGRRLLFELRVNEAGDMWCLDTFLFSDRGRLTLIDRTKWHSLGRWYWAAISYGDGRMIHYVNGTSQGEGRLEYSPMTDGETSLGVRLNRVHWFKGAIAEVRVTDRVLAPEELSRL